MTRSRCFLSARDYILTKYGAFLGFECIWLHRCRLWILHRLIGPIQRCWWAMNFCPSWESERCVCTGRRRCSWSSSGRAWRLSTFWTAKTVSCSYTTPTDAPPATRSCCSPVMIVLTRRCRSTASVLATDTSSCSKAPPPKYSRWTI